jgi:hypothetical protein
VPGNCADPCLKDEVWGTRFCGCPDRFCGCLIECRWVKGKELIW